MVPKSLVAYETAESKRSRGHEDWDPEWILMVFGAWLKCPDAKCGQEVTISGRGGPEPQFDPEEGMSWQDEYQPLFAIPMPDMIDLPAKCPTPVAEELRASFRAFWSDPSSSANHLRSALERLLDDLGVKKKTRSKGRTTTLSLHQRILEFQKGEPTLGGHLLAIKLLGNAGSHGSDVRTSDVLDALEIVEHCLAEIVTQRSKHIAALAKALAKRHRARKGK
jgi:hypothetical protein